MNDESPYGARAIVEASLEAWPNATPDRDYLIEIQSPEFTCLCPRSGYPDFATIKVRYIPDNTIVELRSLKLYLNAYRDRPVSHEGATNQILSDLVTLLEPRWLAVTADFQPRGNVHTVISVWHAQSGWRPSADIAAAIGRSPS